MVKKDFIVLLVAVICGALAFFLILNYLNEAGKPRQRIVLAAADIPQGKRITADQLKMSEPLKNVNNKQYFLTVDDAVGMVALQPIPADRSVSRDKVEKPAIPVQRKLGVPPGRTAVTLGTTDYGILSPQIQIGSYVDISGSVQAEGDQIRSDTVAAGAQIVDMQTLDNGLPAAATIAVYPNEVQDIFDALKRGKVQITWRQGPAAAPGTVTTLKSMEIIRGLKQERTTSFGAK